eukprot:CAMPEP_0198683510 /NCGR_PEP_ID=MMETSP1468-20131203/10728_1 /TAXON_ID=1461545 /ORGANISM="Mantoniella sp, Strain CCMP1436" /LENGTH=54 /DNA_ID=CAMNT_0044427583 /DNA_START=74 /DNA_END=235 /DNA_ORIENTATION=-
MRFRRDPPPGHTQRSTPQRALATSPPVREPATAPSSTPTACSASRPSPSPAALS